MQLPIALLHLREQHFHTTEQQVASIKAQIGKQDGLQLDGPALAQRRKQMLQAVAPEDPVDAYERYIGNNDLLPINYLEIGTARAKAVGRLRYTELPSGSQAMATGFLISPGLLLTNHHVFPAANGFRDALVDFDYAYGADGKELTKIVFQVDPQEFFFTDESLDFTLVGIRPQDLTGVHSIRERGYLILNPTVGKAGKGDPATIIQYPDGNYQQIGLRQNEILDVTDPNLLTYQTDTSPGTSGSPVFNDQWQVIALHSAGVAKKVNGQYVDSKGTVIPIVNGQVDSARIVWISNSGIRISALMKKVSSTESLKNNSLIQFLFSPAYSDDKQQSMASRPQESRSAMSVPGEDQAAPAETPSVSFPNYTGSVNIYIDSTGARLDMPSLADGGSIAFPESKKVLDFSNCKGFQSKGFLNFETPFPKLSATLAKKTVALTDNPKSNVLDYYYYSTVQHAIRKMPVISAINVEGNMAERKDDAQRKDVWLQDPRIDAAVQLTNAYYASSGFDKGHMSRREDADYGVNAAAALKAANMTCMLTNACPQVPKLNRAPGLWGDLEKIILEQGAKKESGTESRICVYNGPIFVDSDPVYKGIQVPMRFFKIVVWVNGKNQKKTTAFVLSQDNLVQGIQFEELDFNKEFVEHQCSVAYIEGLTGLTFTRIRSWDTYIKTTGRQAVKPVKKAGVESLVKKNSG